MPSNEENMLERKLSQLDVWALAFGCIIGFGAFLMPGTTFLKKAGPLGTAIAMGIGVVIMMVLALNYSYMIRHYPRAGGEFTYAQVSFGKNHAFICSWFLGLSYLVLVPSNATALAVIARNLLGNIFQFGFHYRIAGYDIYLGELILSIATLLLFAYLGIRGVKFSGAVQTCLAVALVSGVTILLISAIVSPKAALNNLEPQFYPGMDSFSGVVAVLALAPFAFVGFDTIPQSAEEFRFSPKKTNVIMFISIVFGGAVYIILNSVTAAVVPEGYSGWVEYVNDLDNLDGLVSLPTFHAAYELLGSGGLIVIGVSVLAATLSGVVGFYMASSRLLYSIAKENMLPEWFGKLHQKSKTPRNSIIFVMGISLAATFFGRTALGWIVDMCSVGAAVGYGYTSAASLKCALEEKKKIYVVLGIAGLILSIFFLVVLLIPIPVFSSARLGKESYICLLLWTVLGLVFYIYTKRKL